MPCRPQCGHGGILCGEPDCERAIASPQVPLVFKGYISRQHTVWCGGPDCGDWHQEDVHTIADFTRRIRKRGWAHTKKDGWRCPKHSA